MLNPKSANGYSFLFSPIFSLKIFFPWSITYDMYNHFYGVTHCLSHLFCKHFQTHALCQAPCWVLEILSWDDMLTSDQDQQDLCLMKLIV